MIFLLEPFASAWDLKDPFLEVTKIEGEIYRQVATRRTLKFVFDKETFYIKIHRGTSICEIIKNLISFRLPVIGARNEFNAVKHLHELGINTLDVVAFGEKGINPLNKESFIITKDINPSISLEDYCQNWKNSPPLYTEKKALIEEVAKMVRTMHKGGINHRDCYICHFLLQLPYSNVSSPNLHIIDLHRAQIRSKVPRRWRDKDLIGLYYSSLEIGLNDRDYLRFLKVYFFGERLKIIFKKEKKLIEQSVNKAQKIKERTIRKGL